MLLVVSFVSKVMRSFDEWRKWTICLLSTLNWFAFYFLTGTSPKEDGLQPPTTSSSLPFIPASSADDPSFRTNGCTSENCLVYVYVVIFLAKYYWRFDVTQCLMLIRIQFFSCSERRNDGFFIQWNLPCQFLLCIKRTEIYIFFVPEQSHRSRPYSGKKHWWHERIEQLPEIM